MCLKYVLHFKGLMSVDVILKRTKDDTISRVPTHNIHFVFIERVKILFNPVSHKFASPFRVFL